MEACSLRKRVFDSNPKEGLPPIYLPGNEIGLENPPVLARPRRPREEPRSLSLRAEIRSRLGLPWWRDSRGQEDFPMSGGSGRGIITSLLSPFLKNTPGFCVRLEVRSGSTTISGRTARRGDRVVGGSGPPDMISARDRAGIGHSSPKRGSGSIAGISKSLNFGPDMTRSVKGTPDASGWPYFLPPLTFLSFQRINLFYHFFPLLHDSMITGEYLARGIPRASTRLASLRPG